MNQQRVRTACGFLAVLIMLCACSCGIVTLHPHPGAEDSETYSDGTPIVPPKEMHDYRGEAAAYLQALPKRDFANASFIIRTANPDLFAPEDITYEATSARVARNQEVEKQYNIKLVTIATASEVMFEEASDRAASGLYYADLLSVPMTEITTYLAAGILFNLNSLPFTDFTREYFDQNAMESLSAGDQIFGAVGEATVQLDEAYAIFFNRERLDGGALYTEASSGTWTWDKLYETAAAALQSLDGEDAPKAFAYANGNEAINAMFASSGQKLIASGYGRTPSLAYTPDGLDHLIGQMKKIVRGSDDFPTSENSDNLLQSFSEGGSLFMLSRVGAMHDLANAKSEWGILPMPKADASQTDYHSLCTSGEVLITTGNHADSDATGLMLSALSAASYGHFINAYLSDAKNHDVRDNDSLNMLELMDKTLTYDFAYSIGAHKQEVALATYQSVQNAVFSDNTLDSLYAQYAQAANDTLAKLYPTS